MEIRLRTYTNKSLKKFLLSNSIQHHGFTTPSFMRLLVSALSICILFTTFSCKRSEEIGREVQVGNNDILLVTTDSFHISGSTKKAELERTDERFDGMLGAYTDPIFGPNVISYHTQFHLEEEGFEFPDGAILDSAFVSFRLTGGYREKTIDEDTRSLMHFEVYELAEDLSFESQYMSDDVIKTNPTLVGEFNGNIGLNDSVVVDGVSQPSQIRIPINQTWAQNLISSDPSNFSSNTAFVSFMKGLSIKPIQTNEVNSNGTIFYFNPYSGFTGLTVHYHTNDDTTKFSFITSSLTANFMTFEHDYNSAPVGAIFEDTTTGSNQLFLQATIGTDIELELKDIAAQFAADPKVINIAELYIPVDTAQEYYPISKLSVSRKLEDGTAELLPDQAQTGNRTIDGSFNADSAYYRFLITQYVQEIIHNYTPGSNKSEKLLISPFGNTTTANRSVLNGPRPNDPNAEKMKIVITYTPLN